MRELREIIAEAKDLVTEACAAGYSDGVQMGLDMAIDKRDAERDELCDAFIGVWNDRARLKDELDGIVYCETCKHFTTTDFKGAEWKYCVRHDISDCTEYGYCYWGERK